MLRDDQSLPILYQQSREAGRFFGPLLPLAVGDLHLALVVAGAGDRGRRDGLLDPRQVGGRELYVEPPSDSWSCARVRAPTSGTMFSPLASTQAIASWEGVAPMSSAIRYSASTSRWLRSRFSPVKRGRWARKSVLPVGLEPESRPRDSTP